MGGELALEIDAGAEVDRRHAERSRRLDVLKRIVDEHEFLRPSPDPLEQDFKDAWVRLGCADVAGDHRVVELVEEVEHLAGDRELDGGEVAERVDRAAGGPQTPEQRDILLDRSADGLDPPLVEEMQLMGEFGKGLGALRHRLREVGGNVGEGHEVHRQRGGQEPLHPRLVLHRLAEQVARVPAHEHVADVKDDDQGRGPFGQGYNRCSCRPRDAKIHADTGRASGRLADAVAI